MDLRGFSARAWRLTGALALGIFMLGIAALSGAGLPAARAAGSGLQYDEVTKFVMNGDNPQPGTFAADFQTAVSSAQQRAADNAQQHHGFFSMMKNVANAAKNAVASLKAGTPSTEYFLGPWHRTDDPGAQTATIYKSDQHQIIYLNLAKKTYRIVDMGAAPAPEAPPPPSTNPNEPPPTPMPPGSGKLDVSVSNTLLGPKTIDGVATTGYSFSFKSSMTKSTGSCRDGSFQTSMTEYLSNFAEPGAGTAAHASHFSEVFSHPETNGLPGGCKPSISRHVSGGASPPSGKLSLWMLIALGASAQTQGGAMGGAAQILMERGNVHTLGSGDKQLFEIPAGFTKEQPTPAPS